MKATQQLENIRKVMGDQFIRNIDPGSPATPCSAFRCSTLLCGSTAVWKRHCPYKKGGWRYCCETCFLINQNDKEGLWEKISEPNAKTEGPPTTNSNKTNQ